MSGEVAVLAFVIVGFALISRRVAPTVISGPMVFVAVGLAVGPELFDFVELEVEVGFIDVLGEGTLAILLFADASRINLRTLRHEYMLPARLLGIGLPLTVALTTGIVMLLVDDISVWPAALIAAILSPTDAALGQEVVSDPAVPARIRQGLTVESGLNDGLIVPAVAVFLALATGESNANPTSFWARFIGEQIGIGLTVGVAIGVLGAWLLNLGRRHGWVDGVYAQLATFALAIAALATALSLGGNGFIAAFVGGLLFGKIADESEHLGEFTEDLAQLAAAVSFFIFGNVLLGPALDHFNLTVLLCALAVLTIGRMLPVALAMIGTHAARQTVAFVGWFGPRGLASILFGLLLLEEEFEAADELFAVVAWTVALSVLLHGATAAMGARRYGKWWAARSQDERDHMPEAIEVPEQRRRTM